MIEPRLPPSLPVVRSGMDRPALAPVAPRNLVPVRDVFATPVTPVREAAVPAAASGTFSWGTPTGKTAVVSGGSYTGLASAVMLAKNGFSEVHVVEPREDYTRNIRLGVRQGMVDTLAAIDPALAQEFLRQATVIDPTGFRGFDGVEATRILRAADAARLGDPVFRSQLGEAGVHLSLSPGVRTPDGSRAPRTGAELMKGGSSSVIICRVFEQLLKDYVTKNFPDQIKFVKGKLQLQPVGDGTFKMVADTSQRGGPKTSVDFLKGIQPGLVVVAEGTASSTRDALGIETAPTTPEQHWIAGVLHTTDTATLEPGKATISFLHQQHAVQDPLTHAVRTVPERLTSISDGHEGSWVLTEVPDFLKLDGQQAVNDHFFNRAALVTGQEEATLRAAGVEGPVRKAGSEPTLFALQGRAAREAARVLPDGTAVLLMGDAARNDHFKAGGGMNTSMTEVLSLRSLLEDLHAGVSVKDAAARYQDSVFERGDAWGLAGVPYFYPEMDAAGVKALQDASQEAVRAWRAEGGPSPFARLEAILAESSRASAPVGQHLAA